MNQCHSHRFPDAVTPIIRNELLRSKVRRGQEGKLMPLNSKLDPCLNFPASAGRRSFFLLRVGDLFFLRENFDRRIGEKARLMKAGVRGGGGRAFVPPSLTVKATVAKSQSFLCSVDSVDVGRGIHLSTNSRTVPIFQFRGSKSRGDSLFPVGNKTFMREHPKNRVS